VGSPGSEFHDNLTFRDFSAVFYKGQYAPAYSAFEGVTDDGQKLSEWLRERGVDQLDVCGIATDYCVRATALDAARERFDTTVLLNLTAAVAPDRIPEISTELADAGVAIKESG
jgi:nicotinamidase/pyrazinamidase